MIMNQTLQIKIENLDSLQNYTLKQNEEIISQNNGLDEKINNKKQEMTKQTNESNQMIGNIQQEITEMEDKMSQLEQKRKMLRIQNEDYYANFISEIDLIEETVLSKINSFEKLPKRKKWKPYQSHFGAFLQAIFMDLETKKYQTQVKHLDGDFTELNRILESKKKFLDSLITSKNVEEKNLQNIKMEIESLKQKHERLSTELNTLQVNAFLDQQKESEIQKIHSKIQRKKKKISLLNHSFGKPVKIHSFEQIKPGISSLSLSFFNKISSSNQDHFLIENRFKKHESLDSIIFELSENYAKVFLIKKEILMLKKEQNLLKSQFEKLKKEELNIKKFGTQIETLIKYFDLLHSIIY
ncbi:a-type inclusion protein [Anaeramoeba ignava]|uniref:A-type inclusion protein n=1 Tax=Anaeramoeba ignava TaxID=1746090 RepID=A0A9Q0LEX2_ANAIG|nr:a-type inclusion protein [Anaeramoeba ignava]